MALCKRTMINAREAAYLAILAACRGDAFVSDCLEKWQNETHPSQADYGLAYQLSYGVVQMALALDYLAEQLSERKKLSLKLKEKILLRMALYQVFFLQRIPLFAIADEMQKIAHVYCHRTFVGFLNALLRQLPKKTVQLPTGDSVEEMSIRFSYPPFFVQEMLHQYGLEKTQEILSVGNQSSAVMARLRTGIHSAESEQGMQVFENAYHPMGIISDLSKLSAFTQSKEYYIQNITPVALMTDLCQRKKDPSSILDLCASPGGKLLFAYDAFPKAALYANDVVLEKVQRLKENCDKYGIPAKLSCGDGAHFASQEKFSVIILDAPCSNTGVLNKRPEARWRLNQESLQNLESTQLRLIQHALSLLEDTGEIWYMTCSILSQENEQLALKTAREYNLQLKWQKLILPNHQGWDGGYACVLIKDPSRP